MKSIAAIIHFRALMPPYTQVAFRPPYTPRNIYAFLKPQISVCIPPSVNVFEEHCCNHTFLSIAASIQPNTKHCKCIDWLTYLIIPPIPAGLFIGIAFKLHILTEHSNYLEDMFSISFINNCFHIFKIPLIVL